MFIVRNVCVILQPKRSNGAYRLCGTWWCVAEQVDVRVYQHRDTVEIVMKSKKSMLDCNVIRSIDALHFTNLCRCAFGGGS